MQIVQAFGLLRKYMRTSTGQVFFAVPESLSECRIHEDRKRFTRLLNDKLFASDDYSRFQSSMTSAGVRDWLLVGYEGKNDCALKILSGVVVASSEFYNNKNNNDDYAVQIVPTNAPKFKRRCRDGQHNTIDNNQPAFDRRESFWFFSVLVVIATIEFDNYENNYGYRTVGIFQTRASEFNRQ
jgi:hypothetical protein